MSKSKLAKWGSCSLDRVVLFSDGLIAEPAAASGQTMDYRNVDSIK